MDHTHSASPCVCVCEGFTHTWVIIITVIHSFALTLQSSHLYLHQFCPYSPVSLPNHTYHTPTPYSPVLNNIPLSPHLYSSPYPCLYLPVLITIPILLLTCIIIPLSQLTCIISTVLPPTHLYSLTFPCPLTSMTIAWPHTHLYHYHTPTSTHLYHHSPSSYLPVSP